MRDEASTLDTKASGTTGRALLVLERPRSAPGTRPMAGFIAQLLACDGRIGAFRRAYRVAAPVGVERYAHSGGALPSFRRDV